MKTYIELKAGLDAGNFETYIKTFDYIDRNMEQLFINRLENKLTSLEYQKTLDLFDFISYSIAKKTVYG